MKTFALTCVSLVLAASAVAQSDQAACDAIRAANVEGDIKGKGQGHISYRWLVTR